MESIIVHPKNKKQLATVQAVLELLGISFTEEKMPSVELEEIIEKGRNDAKTGKTIKIKPADIWNLT